MFKIIPKKIRLFLKELFCEPHPSPVFILGNQKSGTTVIAALLGQLTGLPTTLDLKKEFRNPVFHEVWLKKRSFASFIRRNKSAFFSKIIKEPNLTFFYSDLAGHFPEARFVYIVRDPRSNIRSILNRLKTPGNLPDISSAHFSRFPKVWQLVVNSEWMGDPPQTYIEFLANRWNKLVSIYLQNQKSTILIRYEDFMRDKAGTIRLLAKKLELPEKFQIEDKVDIQYQPRGDRDISWPDFFGPQNLRLIEETCLEKMRLLGYEKNPC